MPAAQPNVVFIFADQLSARHCGPYGNEHVRTPTMDRMAERGVVFENFYANSALCGPSRFSTFTGQMPFAHPLWAQPNCVGLPNLPYMGHLMRNAGYATASIGKLHGMPEDFDFGFEHCRINWGLHGKFPFNAYGRWVDQRLAERTDGEKLRELFQQPHDGGFGESLTDEQYQYVPPELSEEAWLLDETERFLQDRPTGRPFFLHLGIQHPHHPWETIPREDERYDPEAMPLPPNFESDSPIAAALRDAKQQGKADGRDGVDPEEKRRRRRRTVARYYSSVTQVDKAIGRVFDMLQAHGVADNTVVVLAADHGEMLGEHGRLGKTTFHEASVHVPMIVCGPGVPAGERRRQLAEQIDLISTFLDFAGAEPPAHLEGQSMLPAIRDASAETKPFVHAWLEFHFGELHAMVRGENLKLCRLVGVPRRSSIPETFELHDVTRDPWELDNLWPDNATSAEARATRREFADYFWRKCGMMGCPPATRDALLGT